MIFPSPPSTPATIRVLAPSVTTPKLDLFGKLLSISSLEGKFSKKIHISLLSQLPLLTEVHIDSLLLGGRLILLRATI